MKLISRLTALSWLFAQVAFASPLSTSIPSGMYKCTKPGNMIPVIVQVSTGSKGQSFKIDDAVDVEIGADCTVFDSHGKEIPGTLAECGSSWSTGKSWLTISHLSQSPEDAALTYGLSYSYTTQKLSYTEGSQANDPQTFECMISYEQLDP